MPMNSRSRIFGALLICCLPLVASAHDALLIKPLAERKMTELPPGPLVWLIETFDSVASAKAAEGPGRSSWSPKARFGCSRSGILAPGRPSEQEWQKSGPFLGSVPRRIFSG